jgi:hypothetical protein
MTLCHPTERDLIVAGATRLVAAGERMLCDKCEVVFDARCPDCQWVAPQRWVDATGPCPTCGEAHAAVDAVCSCVDCDGDGRKREALQVAIPLHGHDAIGHGDGLVTFAYATVEVLPVYEGHPATEVRRFIARQGAVSVLVDRDANKGEYIDLLPVAGRDWVVLLDNVELVPSPTTMNP